MRRKSIGLFRRGRRWYLKYKSAKGVWSEYATGKVQYLDALEERRIFLADLEAGRAPNDRTKGTLGEVTVAWLNDRGWRVARGTMSSERTIVGNLLRSFGAKTKVVEIAEIHSLRRYESSRLAQGKSPKTVNNEVQVLAGILRDANLWQRVAPHYRPLRVPKTDVGSALTKAEERRLLQFAKTADANAVVPYAAALSFATGIRSGELKKLQIGSIHLEGPNPYLYVRRSTTKTDKGARFVALDAIGLWALKKLLLRAKLLGAGSPEHYLLPTLLDKHTRSSDPLKGGRGFDFDRPQTSWDAEWNQLRKSLQIEHRRFHDLRHSYITRAAEAGVPLAVTQAQVGHLSVQMVEHYTHVCQAAIHRAAKQIEAASSDLLSILNLPSSSGTSNQLPFGHQTNE